MRIHNDSPFNLQAEILAADGTKKASLKLTPQQSVSWNEPSTQSSWSETPYTVILTCKDGKEFGVISNVQQGATVTAMMSSGPRYCQPEKKKKEEDKNSSLGSPNTG